MLCPTAGKMISGKLIWDTAVPKSFEFLHFYENNTQKWSFFTESAHDFAKIGLH